MLNLTLLLANRFVAQILPVVFGGFAVLVPCLTLFYILNHTKTDRI